MKFTLPFLFAALASAAPTELQRRDEATCGSVHYTASAVSAAADASCNYVQDHSTAGSSTYPHQYKNYEGFEFKGLSGPFYEFPILKSGSVYNGGSPGADRVIITQSCEQAGVITHQGASGNNFVACEGGDNTGDSDNNNNGNSSNGNKGTPQGDDNESWGFALAAADTKVLRAALGMGAVFLMYIF